MKLYNTLTNKKEDFIPLTEGEVKMYVCGPTVYNFIHIGNARPMIVFDTVRRYFEYKGYKVNYVSNFTDVDDKIIKRANELGKDSSYISEKYIQECLHDMNALNIKRATTHPKATEEIDGMIEMIDTLIEKGYAYEADGTVYYATRQFKEYGKLSGKNLDDLEAGHREIKVTGEEGKRDFVDFVLWKPKKEGEPFWKSPWSDGRPGWHIECSVMSKKYLGEEIDIHAGGEDLIFPHHENEIAQSEAANGKQFAKYWLHNAFLNIDGVKMAKSLGNFFTVREICDEFKPVVLRFFMLSAHYRSPLNFSKELMEASENGLMRIITAIKRLTDITYADRASSEDEKAVMAEIGGLRDKFEAAMDDDFNTADAISVLFELVKLANVKVSVDSSAELGECIVKTFEDFTNVLGIDVTAFDEDSNLDAEIEDLINQRTEARKNKDFAKADEIRDKLLEMGIILKDTREGVKWTRA